MNRKHKIGIDIGRVIIGPVLNGKADTSFLGSTIKKSMETPPSPGALEGVKKLVEVFEGQAWLVSKCGPNVQYKTKKWLHHWDFYQLTGLLEQNVRFCLERHQKAAHCKQLKLNFFIDDRMDVLQHLQGIVPNLFLFGEQKSKVAIPRWVTHVKNWNETVEQVSNRLVV